MRRFFLVSTLVLLASLAFATDIANMPTANQLKAGQYDIGTYYVNLDFPDGYPQFVQNQELYIGVTDRLELGVSRSRVDKDLTSNVFIGSYKVMSESMLKPDMVVGIRNFTNDQVTANPAQAELSKKASYFISTAKTFCLDPSAPAPPILRFHLGYGTEDWTVAGDVRHNGFFGGAQMLVTPAIGVVALYDAQDTIYVLSVMPKNSGLTLKAGTIGDHTWFGASFMKDF